MSFRRARAWVRAGRGPGTGAGAAGNRRQRSCKRKSFRGARAARAECAASVARTAASDEARRGDC